MTLHGADKQYSEKSYVIPLLTALPKAHFTQGFQCFKQPKPITVCDTKTERFKNNWTLIDVN